MILGGGIIRSGGNTKTIMIIDIIGTWCIGIPLCLLAAYVFKLGNCWCVYIAYHGGIVQACCIVNYL